MKYVNIPLETLHKFKPEHKAGLLVYCRLLALVTTEVELDPPHKTACGLDAERAGVVLEGGVFTDEDLAERIDNYPKNSLRHGRNVLAAMGLVILDLSRNGYRLALLGCCKYRKLKAIGARYAWVNRVLGRVEVAKISQPQESEVANISQPAAKISQPGAKISQPQPHPALRGQQVTDPKSENKSENKANITNDSDIALLNCLEVVWTYYLVAIEQSPKIYTLTPRRQKVGLERMRDLTERGASPENAARLLKLAIDNITASDWHAGRDPKTNGAKFLDWEKHLFGTTEMMEKWLEKSGPIPQKQSTPIGTGHTASGSVQ